MSADKRTPHTDALETLGTIIGDGEKRDAIHLAVEPVIAGCDLRAGDHVTLKDGVAVRAMPTQGLGIVDPFIDGPVEKGQRFWLVVYPRQISSLRHVWEHPDFPLSGETDAPVVDLPAKRITDSEQWMRAWAKKHMGYNYYGDGELNEDDAYANAIRAGEDGYIGPYEEARGHINDEWWNHWETITGRAGNRDQYFSCSC